MASLDDKYGDETVISPETRTHIYAMASGLRVSAITALVASITATVLGITLAYVFWVTSQKKGADDEYVWAIFGLVFIVPGVLGLMASIVSMKAAGRFSSYIEEPREDMLNIALDTKRRSLFWSVAVNALLILVLGGAIALLFYGIIVKGL